MAIITMTIRDMINHIRITTFSHLEENIIFFFEKKKRNKRIWLLGGLMRWSFIFRRS